MEALVDIVNQLQDIQARSGFESVDLPQIVVVGSQSSGKSSVLEHIVGKSFLPRGNGVVTRCPLVLQLEHSGDGTVDCAIFSHAPKKTFTDYNLIKQEIENQTVKLAGENKGICNKSINLKMFSSSVTKLTLIDLPGIVKVPLEDQPPDIEMQVKTLILSFIQKSNCLILAVTPANLDLATSESLKIAREVDPKGERTLLVITKLDLMDKGTDAWDMLQGQIIPVKLGIIGVVNRSQKDIQDGKSISESLKDEEQFLKKSYPRIASRHGSGYLTETVQGLLISHIKACLPNLKKWVSAQLAVKRAELDKNKESDEDKAAILNELLFKFSREYVSVVNGNLTNIVTNELYGGARINYVFKQFSKALNSAEALDGFTESHIMTAIQNASGVEPDIFVPEVAFQFLVKKQIDKLRTPSLKCVDLVLEEMKGIVNHCFKEHNLGLEQYFKLETELDNAMATILDSFIPKSKQMVNSFIEVQLAHINIDHQEFFPNIKESLFVTANENLSGKLNVVLPRGTTVQSYDKQTFDYNLILTLTKSYFNIVKKTIQDTIPKTIMCYLVNPVREQLYRELDKRLCSQAEDLLEETQSVIDKRKALRNEIAELEKVQKVIISISLSTAENTSSLSF